MSPRQTLYRDLAERLHAVVFDFDGTLARLEIDFDLMLSRILSLAEEYDWQAEGREVRYVLETTAAVEADLLARDPDAARNFSLRARTIIENIELKSAREAALFSETRPVLTALRAHGLKLGLITRNIKSAVRLVFPDLGDFFGTFLARDDVVRVKPDPGHLQAALDVLAVRPKNTLMVGDHPIDVKTGMQAGTLTAGVASGRIGREELAAAGADLTFDHLGELAEYLLGNWWPGPSFNGMVRFVPVDQPPSFPHQDDRSPEPVPTDKPPGPGRPPRL
ncbi:MAG: HAD family hydrolase [Proteobacteria bacterium]|nr:HAD family hydrolase [Pseudomonadota bacterium]